MSGVSSLLVFAGLFTTQLLVDPNPVHFDPSRNPSQIAVVTLRAIADAGWRPEQIKNNEIRATFRRSRHEAIVLVHLDRDAISMTYEASSNLDYEKQPSKTVIHKAYLEWTGALMSSIRSRIGNLCPDMSLLLDPGHTGRSFASLVDEAPAIRGSYEELNVASSSGAPTGLVVREYKAFMADAPSACETISTVFYDDKFVSVTRDSVQLAALTAYSDLLNHLVAIKEVSFQDAEIERVSLKTDLVAPLDGPRREALLRYVEWQAQRYDRKETTREEYGYLLAEKEAEIQERQVTIDQKERELAQTEQQTEVLRRQQEVQSASLEVQRKQLATQRSLSISQALENLIRSRSYQPVVSRTITNCTSNVVGNSVKTSCY
jgi:hypothetical protein